MRQPAELLPGVDLEEIEDEFEELHRCRFSHKIPSDVFTEQHFSMIGPFM